MRKVTQKCSYFPKSCGQIATNLILERKFKTHPVLFLKVRGSILVLMEHEKVNRTHMYTAYL